MHMPNAGTAQWSEARGQRASDQHPATSASSGQRPEHQSPEPSALATQIGYGMVRLNGTRFIQQLHPELATASRPSWATRSRDCLLGKGAVMQARLITQYRDCGLAENPRPPSQDDNSRAERKSVSPYVGRGTALRLSRDNRIGQSVAGHPSRLEFP